jgi:hypothetical protein
MKQKILIGSGIFCMVMAVLIVILMIIALTSKPVINVSYPTIASLPNGKESIITKITSLNPKKVISSNK